MLKRTLLPILAVALLSACGKKEEAKPVEAPAPATQAPAAAPAASAAAPAAAADLAKGESVYKKTCSLCHATGAAGAPTFGSKSDWEPRVAQGKDTLYQHAVNGFTGSKGMMPPKGGNASLSDEDVKAGVDYMTQAAK